MRRPVIAIVGGGVYAPRLCALLSRALPTGGSLRLSARRLDRLAAITAAAAACSTGAWDVSMAPSLAACVDGADAVVLLVRIGGLAARAHDEAFPRRFGLVGDEGLGPGGFANGYRSVPPLTELARTLRRGCPRALICNLVAPLGITTRLLLDEGLNAVGVCELPAVTLAELVGPAGDGGDLQYAGLNHLGWFWSETPVGKARLGEAVARGIVDGPTLAQTGAAPLHYYYELFDCAAARRLGIERRPGRARELATLAEATLAAFATSGRAEGATVRRPTPWFDRALVPLLTARLADLPYDGFVNVRNQGPIVPAVPPAAVVEVRARVAEEVVAVKPTDCPAFVSQALATMADAEDLAYQAARGQDPQLLSRALQALPLQIDAARAAALVDAALSPPPPLEAS